MKRIIPIIAVFFFFGCSDDAKTLYIINHSSDPYEIFVNDQFKQTLQGGNSLTIDVKVGSTYQLKAQQAKGSYLIYPSIYTNTATITESKYDVSWSFPD